MYSILDCAILRKVKKQEGADSLLNPFKETWKPNHVKRNTIIQIIIATFAFIMLIRIWPYGMVKTHTYSKQGALNDTDLVQGEIFTSTDKKLQTVIFTNEHIYQIKIYMYCTFYDESIQNTGENSVLFRLYDENFSCIYEEDYSYKRIAAYNCLKATPDLDVVVGKNYYYEVIVPENSVAALNLPTANNSMLSQYENSALYIDGIINTQDSLVADFDYSKELSVWGIIGYYALIIICALIIYAVVLWLLWYFEAYTNKAVFYAKRIFTGLTLIGAVILLVITVGVNIFDSGGWDRLVYAIGSISGAVWILCAIWMPRKKITKAKLKTSRQISFIWRNYIQTVSFALLFYALCQYVNADREYYHYTNTRWMLIFFGIAVLMIQSEKELFSIINYLWLGVGFIGAVIYCSSVTGEQELYLAKLSAAVVVIWGLVVIQLLMYIPHSYKDIWKKTDKPMLIIWGLFVIFIFANRFEKTWPFTATLPFAAIVLYNLNTAQKSRILKNFTNGILLSFCMTTVFCFLHRPFHYWMLYRYNGIFHTVACTGMYLSVVFAAAVGKLYAKLKVGADILKNCWCELFVTASVVSFILFTMSRTAILTVMINFILVLMISVYVNKKSPKLAAKECGILLCAVLMTFPLMFSALRMIPAISNEPIRYDLEFQDKNFMIYKDEPIDSDKYMNIERYFEVFFGRFNSDEQVAAETEVLLAYNTKNVLPAVMKASQDGSQNAEASDISNGRFDIFREYLKSLNISGHEKMSLEEKDYAHAHNSYIQTAYDFGIIAGILFLILCAYTLICSIKLYINQGERHGIYIVPFSLIVSFGVVSVTEWAFHPCIPSGFTFLFMTMILMQNTSDRVHSIQDVQKDNVS